MIYFIDAIAMAFIAAIWSKEGSMNIVLALGFTILAVINAALAAPFVLSWVGR